VEEFEDHSGANLVTTLSPMFQQYQRVKKEHPEALVLFRLGDFYELFGSDAETAAPVLELVLTSREIGKGNRIAMCGVPHHAVDRYVTILLRRGFRVAVCEQVEDPRLAKGLVKREVTRIITPGTVVEDNLLDSRANNYLASLVVGQGSTGLSFADVSTGDFRATEFEQSEDALQELTSLSPAECLCSGEGVDRITEQLSSSLACPLTKVDASADFPESSAELLKRHFETLSLAGFGLEELPMATESAANLLRYLEKTHPEVLPQLKSIHVYATGEFMTLDSATRRNLELTAPLRAGSPFTLLGVLDKTQTAMGARLLKSWLLSPLLSVEKINERLDSLQVLLENAAGREEVRRVLKAVGDLQRLTTKLAANGGNPRDLAHLRDSLTALPDLKTALSTCSSALLQNVCGQMDLCEELRRHLTDALIELPPASATEGGFIKDGYSEELDRLRGSSRQGKDWIASLETRERERTGIKSLKVGYNQVFGYYIEVSKPNLNLIPQDYVRKQTLSNAERFYTPELKEHEAMVLGAEERIAALEYDLFCGLRERVGQKSLPLLQTAQAAAIADALCSLAQVAVANGYVRPSVNEGEQVCIAQGRHPVLEQALGKGRFVPNDSLLNCLDRQLLIITGPNMAGKSTYLRQVALIIILAQMGSFVPAREAEIGLVDRIFTRVGAFDDLVGGQSTFMLEMTETANILHNCTAKSLVLFDEIGRGTSTYDGLSIAWAVAEHIHNLGTKALFATHFHQLNQLGEQLPRANNLRIAVREEKGRMVFLYRIMEGGTDRSYGIQVAKLAGLPQEVVERAKQVLWQLERTSDRRQRLHPPDEQLQLTLFEPATNALAQELQSVDPDQLTPMQALEKLYELKRLASEEQQAKGDDK
jgi:DNA mismatch repair protein MutS